MIETINLPEAWGEEAWIIVFEAVIEHTVLEHEDPKDILVGSWVLGKRRADILEHRFWPGVDVVYPLCVFCWWPFKPPLPIETREYLQNKRWELFKGASVDSNVIKKLNESVPDRLLSLDLQTLNKLQLNQVGKMI